MNDLKRLKQIFLRTQAKVSDLHEKLQDARSKRNAAFQAYHRRLYNMKPGDPVMFRGRQKTFHGTFDSFCTDNEWWEPGQTEEVYARFNVDEAQYTCGPKELRHDVIPGGICEHCGSARRVSAKKAHCRHKSNHYDT